MTGLSAQTIISTNDPESIIEELCEHFSEDGAFVTGQPRHRTVTFDFGSGQFIAKGNQLLVKIEADDLIELYNFRWTMAQHIVEIAEVVDFEWSGAASHLTMPPYFRLLTVSAVQSLTPKMKRITFRGDDLAAFSNDEELHVRLYIPRGSASEAEWPSVAKNGIPQHPSGDNIPVIRRYTIRQVNLSEGTLDIDFVLHEDAGPGSAFAEHATIGNVVGISGPGASSCPVDSDWYLLAGDETALPAIARILEFLPSRARGIAVIEVADKAEEQELKTNSDLSIHWIHRDQLMDSKNSGLVQFIKNIDLPDDGSTCFVWFAGEFNSFREIRLYLRKEKKLKKHQHLAVSYWRNGELGDNSEENLAEKTITV